MRLELLNSVQEQYSTIEQILLNRGIPPEEFYHYLNTTDDDINDFTLLGENNLYQALSCIITTVANKQKAVIVVDCDCDIAVRRFLLTIFIIFSLLGLKII